MRKILALTFALLLLLTACGQENIQADGKPSERNAANSGSPEAALPTEDYFVQEETMEDGTKVTSYRNGGADGLHVRVRYVFPEGGYAEESYDAEGNIASMIFSETDGSVFENYFYPSGNISKNIVTYPDGSHDEVHYMDNGTINVETGEMTAGTVTYQVHISADGKKQELVSGVQVEEDGSRWESAVLEDGSKMETRYSKDGIVLAQIWEDPSTGRRTETERYEDGTDKKLVMDDPTTGMRTESEYYPDGLEKKVSATYAGSDRCVCREYYETGILKYLLNINEDGTKQEYKCNEQGYVTYNYEKNLLDELEYFGDESGTLVKYIENGTVYEGTGIPASAVNVFQMIQGMIGDMHQKKQ